MVRKTGVSGCTTGWTGLSEVQKNPYTGEDIKPYERQWLNRWIGENGNWDGRWSTYELDEGVREGLAVIACHACQLPICKYTFING